MTTEEIDYEATATFDQVERAMGMHGLQDHQVRAVLQELTRIVHNEQRAETVAAMGR